MDVNTVMQLRFFPFLLLALTAALPAKAADEVRPRLVPGGMDVIQGDKPVELLTTKDFSVGTLSPIVQGVTGLSPLPLPPPSTGTGTMFDKLALGGYVAYSLDKYAVTSTIRNRDSSTGTDFSASYAGSMLGVQGVTALTLGYDWHHPTMLLSSDTPAPGLNAFDAANAGVSLSVSWNHAITPSLYFGGFAAAQHITPQYDDILPQTGNAFKLGAGLGVKF